MCQFPVQLDALYYSELLKVTTVISSYYLIFAGFTVTEIVKWVVTVFVLSKVIFSQWNE